MNPSLESFLVWGAGGHGKVLADLIRACGFSVTGFVDGDESKIGRQVEPGGGRVLLSETDFLQNLQRSSKYVPGGADALALALGENQLRHDALSRLDEWPVPSLVHPSASVSPSATLGRGSVVLPGAIINAQARVGRVVIVNSGAVIEHDCVISDAAHVSPGAVLAGGVRVGERTWIGAGATVIQGIEVGPDAIIGAGAAVIRDVPPNTVVVGVPARRIRGS